MLIQASNGLAPFSYSIDNGNTFQSSNIFTGLSAGNYEVIVRDKNNCEFTESIELGMTTNTNSTASEIKVEVFPNPTKGIFKVTVAGLPQNSNNLELQIFNVNGQRIQTVKIPNYDGVYQGLVSLAVQPVGLYFLKFKTENLEKIFPVLKLSE